MLMWWEIYGKNDGKIVEERQLGIDEGMDGRVCRSGERKDLPMASTCRFIS